MSRAHAYHHMCGCAQCCRTERAAEMDDELRQALREDLIACPMFIGELALAPLDCERVSAAIRDRDMAELGRVYVAALEREADDAIERRADEDDMTPGEAAQRLYDIYRPEPERKAA